MKAGGGRDRRPRISTNPSAYQQPQGENKLTTLSAEDKVGNLRMAGINIEER